jgi:hypothetical protein
MATVFVYFKRNPYGASKIIFILSMLCCNGFGGYHQSNYFSTSQIETLNQEVMGKMFKTIASFSVNIRKLR